MAESDGGGQVTGGEGVLSSEEMLRLLHQLHRGLREQIMARWNRSVPFADELFDRHERARHLGFGEGVSVYDSSLIIGKVSVGRKTWIGPFTVLDGSGGLAIGEFCSISAGVQIYSHDTVDWALSGGKEKPREAPVRIGDRCYIGPNVVVGKGVTIGEGSVIGAQSYVGRDIPPGSKAWGSPCRVTGKAGTDPVPDR